MKLSKDLSKSLTDYFKDCTVHNQDGIPYNEDKMPNFWPVLKSGDIGKGQSFYTIYLDKCRVNTEMLPCCSRGWLVWLLDFEYNTNSLYKEIAKKLIENFLEINPHLKEAQHMYDPTTFGIWFCNDRSSPKQRVEAWNKTGRDLGYTEIEE